MSAVNPVVTDIDLHKLFDDYKLCQFVSSKDSIDPTDNILIANQSTEIIWIINADKRFHTTKNSITYHMRIGIEVPFESEEMRRAVIELNDLRPLNENDRVSPNRLLRTKEMQNNLKFMLTRYWCIQCINRRANIPLFLKDDLMYTIFFKDIMNKYIRCKLTDTNDIFNDIKQKLDQVVFKNKLAQKDPVEDDEKDYKEGLFVLIVLSLFSPPLT